MVFSVEEIISKALKDFASMNGERECEFITLLSQEEGPIKAMKRQKVRIFYRSKNAPRVPYKKIFETNVPFMNSDKIAAVKSKVLAQTITELLQKKDNIWSLINTKPQ